MPPEKPRRLGRGLEALLATAPGTGPAASEHGTLRQIPTSQIRPNPFQPRKDFRADELADLEASMKASGLLQPVTVRPLPGNRAFELVAGERRFRAATRLGWTQIPALVKDIDDRTLLTLALVENLQRSDLNAIEEAEGYKRLLDEFKHTQQQVADAVGKDRSTVANMLRLLNLPATVRQMLREGHLSLGHARALLGLPNDKAIAELAREVVARGLSVRDVERKVRESVPAKRSANGKTAKAAQRDPEVRRIEDQLRRLLQTDVTVALSSKERGEIRIAFYSADDLQRTLELLLGAPGEVL